jgi:integrase/recombinase XerD
MINLSENTAIFVTPTRKAKPEKSLKDRVSDEVFRKLKEHHFDYEELRYIFRVVRKRLQVKRPKSKRTLPKVLTEVELRRFFQTIEDCGNIEHQIMLRLLFFTAIRVSELVDIKRDDVNMGEAKIYIDQGKGGKDRYVLFPEGFKLALASHREAYPRNKFLFESRQHGQYTTRRIQQIVEGYGAKAGVVIRVHLLRHQMLTWLTQNGLTDAQIQLISGHASKKSLEVYQHIGLESVHKAYQDAAQLAEASLNGRHS